MKLDERVALVTGAGSGIGAAIARRYATAGARVAALSRTPDEIQDVVRDIERGGGTAMAVLADVSDAAAMERAVREVVDRWGRLDVVVPNAGVNGVWAPIEELAPDEFARTIAINLTGTFLTIKYAAPHLKRQGGSVVVVSSINGTRVFSNTGATAYSASKAGQVAITKMLALELAKHRVRVNVICPGKIETEIEENTEHRDLERVKEPVEFPEGDIPLTDGRPGTADQVADLALFLASDASTHITGTEVWIDGGQSLMHG
jgi:NAD(P)-dependent dehydrogenase (short-subunit alcohol dehydrogenase family)